MAFVFSTKLFCIFSPSKQDMNLPFITDRIFEKQDYSQTSLPKAEYDNCTFIRCDFSDSFLSYVSFTACEFIDCNLSGIKIKDTLFKDILFSSSKILGVNFCECSDFLFSFKAEHSTFSFSSFFNKNLNSTSFKNCILENVDFTKANLFKAKFSDSDLKHAIFENTNLEQVDFRTATNFNINPAQNKLKHAKFSKNGALSLLNNLQIVVESF